MHLKYLPHTRSHTKLRIRPTQNPKQITYFPASEKGQQKKKNIYRKTGEKG